MFKSAIYTTYYILFNFMGRKKKVMYITYDQFK